MSLRVVPLTLREANELVSKWHRHHKSVQGHRFSLGVVDGEGVLHGAVIVGRPVARSHDPSSVAEVTRLVTDGTSNACSFLYGAAARVAREMGFKRIQTYILVEELGTSLRASGWVHDRTTSGDTWTRAGRPNRRQDQPTGPKQRWRREL